MAYKVKKNTTVRFLSIVCLVIIQSSCAILLGLSETFSLASLYGATVTLNNKGKI